MGIFTVDVCIVLVAVPNSEIQRKKIGHNALFYITANWQLHVNYFLGNIVICI